MVPDSPETTPETTPEVPHDFIMIGTQNAVVVRSVISLADDLCAALSQILDTYVISDALGKKAGNKAIRQWRKAREVLETQVRLGGEE